MSQPQNLNVTPVSEERTIKKKIPFKLDSETEATFANRQKIDFLRNVTFSPFCITQTWKKCHASQLSTPFHPFSLILAAVKHF